jgi:hypothetical protein
MVYRNSKVTQSKQLFPRSGTSTKPRIKLIETANKASLFVAVLIVVARSHSQQPAVATEGEGGDAGRILRVLQEEKEIN